MHVGRQAARNMAVYNEWTLYRGCQCRSLACTCVQRYPCCICIAPRQTVHHSCSHGMRVGLHSTRPSPSNHRPGTPHKPALQRSSRYHGVIPILQCAACLMPTKFGVLSA